MGRASLLPRSGVFCPFLGFFGGRPQHSCPWRLIHGSAFRRLLAGASWGYRLRPMPKGACRGCRWRLPRRAIKERSYVPHHRGRAVTSLGFVPPRYGKAEVRPLATWRHTVQTQSGRLGQQQLVLRAYAFGSRQHQPQQRQRERQTGRQQQLHLGGAVRLALVARGATSSIRMGRQWTRTLLQCRSRGRYLRCYAMRSSQCARIFRLE